MAKTQHRLHHQDQAARLRELVGRRARPAMTLAITSGKGGVGKSNVAANLAICLAGRGLRTTLVDVDMGLANADLLLNVQPRYTLSHVLSGLRGIERLHGSGLMGHATCWIHSIRSSCSTPRLSALGLGFRCAGK